MEKGNPHKRIKKDFRSLNKNHPTSGWFFVYQEVPDKQSFNNQKGKIVRINQRWRRIK